MSNATGAFDWRPKTDSKSAAGAAAYILDDVNPSAVSSGNAGP